jgi:hypothetical protein
MQCLLITRFLQKGLKAAQHFCNSYFLSSSVMHMIRCSFFLSILCYFAMHILLCDYYIFISHKIRCFIIFNKTSL